MERLANSNNRVVGTRQVMRALKAGRVASVYLANDSDTYIFQQIIREAESANIPAVRVPTMKELGKACGVEVATAAAAILK